MHLLQRKNSFCNYYDEDFSLVETGTVQISHFLDRMDS